MSPVQTKRGAEAYERQVHDELLAGTWGKPVVQPKEVQTLEEFSKEFMKTYVKANNGHCEEEAKASLFRRYLIPELGELRLDAIGGREIERLKATMLDKGLSPKTVNNALACLSKTLRWAEEIGDLGDGRAAPRVRFIKTPDSDFDFLTFDELERLLVAARRHGQDWWAQCLVAARTGLRYGELCELRWSDVDLVVGKLRVSRSFTKKKVKGTKSGRNREVPLSPETVAALKAHRHLRGELVFCKPDGGRRIHRRADVAIKTICRLAGLRKIGWHVLRHTFASHLVMRGVPLKAVQELLGHSTIQMTMRYSHLAPEVKRDAVALLDSAGHHLGTEAKAGGEQQ